MFEVYLKIFKLLTRKSDYMSIYECLKKYLNEKNSKNNEISFLNPDKYINNIQERKNATNKNISSENYAKK